MMTNESSADKVLPGRVADRLTVLLGLNGLLIDGAFGPLNERQKGAVVEMLQTAEELRTLLEPMIPRR
jgi:hypothetical protein